MIGSNIDSGVTWHWPDDENRITGQPFRANQAGMAHETVNYIQLLIELKL